MARIAPGRSLQMQPAATGIAKRPERHPQQDGRVENLSLVFLYAF
jgi:hypothetical protein